MTAGNRRVVLSSDHSAIALRQVIAGHIAAQGWQVVDIGPTTRESTPYPARRGRVAGEALALDIVDAFLAAAFDGGRHGPRVEMIKALEGDA